MIPYQDMTYGDWNFYWGESVLFAKRNGKWAGVRPATYDSTGRFIYDEDQRLDDIESNGDKVPFRNFHTNEKFWVRPMEPFKSDDWVTYEPPLGYFILNGRLALIASTAPRNRIKGLHQRRLQGVIPLDSSALSTAVARLIHLEGTSGGSTYAQLVREIERRMDTPFPSSWYSPIMQGIKDSTTPAVILHSDAALVPIEGTDTGHLLFKGALIGKLTAVGTKLMFTPRCKPTTNIESAVNSWVQSKLIQKRTTV
jgi:hypothetical protein